MHTSYVKGVYAFRRLLPLFQCYDHTNYALWGGVYLAEMYLLHQEAKDDFYHGNLGVKGSIQQINPGHSQQWLNCTAKKRGAIVSITNTTFAMKYKPGPRSWLEMMTEFE